MLQATSVLTHFLFLWSVSSLFLFLSPPALHAESHASVSELRITSSTPAPNATRIAVDHLVSIHFDEALNTETLSPSSLFLSSNSQVISATLLWGRKTVTLIPSENLKHNQSYQIHVTTQVQSISGNSLAQDKIWNFKTVSAPDSIPPRILSVFPKPNAKKVEIQTEIQIQFSEALNLASVNASTFLLTDSQGENVTGSLKIEENHVSFTPTQKLQLKSQYSFSVMKGVRDEADNALSQNKTWTFSTTSLDENMILIPPGSFIQGEAGRVIPPHRVTLTQEYYIGRQEVSVAEYQKCVRSGACTYTERKRKHATFGVSGKENFPMNYVSWLDAQNYVQWLTQNAAIQYRLCTEAEWEYAARANTQSLYACGDSWSCLNNSAWHSLNTPSGGPQELKSKNPNAWGIYDLLGNVWEWVADRYGKYRSQAVSDPKGASSGNLRVLRGGGYRNPPKVLYSARRGSAPAEERTSYIGFRICANP